jgi:hypothetical protein
MQSEKSNLTSRCRKGQRYAGLMSEYDEQLRRYRSFIEDEKNIVFPKDARRRYGMGTAWDSLSALTCISALPPLSCSQ